MIRKKLSLVASRRFPLLLLLLLSVFAIGCGSPVGSATNDGSDRVSDPIRVVGSAPHSDPSSDNSPATFKTGATSGVKLAGRVVFNGPPPERRAIVMTKDPACIKLHGDQPVLSEELIIADDGGVKNAFVYVRKGAPKIEYPVPDKLVELDQKNCMYHPRVQGMMVGQKLSVLNSDPVTHNVRSFPVRNRAFNFGQPADSGPRDRVFDQPEREIEIQCDIHPWMHAYLFVMDHPFFAVTDDHGNYTIEGLPPGEYSLAIWHEQLGKQQRDVKVADQDVADVTFTFKP